ncbi:MAG: hypothetical protein FWF85_02170 [Clostridiales bacterium]|nr:hypothetical protein [Clostridiales bacterium]
MTGKFYDPIVDEVRKNREELLAEFGGDINKLDAYLEPKRPAREAAGFHYVTEEERQARLTWNRQQQEEFEYRIKSLQKER